jgi:hypothetical protein
VGLRSLRLVLLLGAPKCNPSKIREKDGVSALGGRRLEVKRDNQPKVGVSGEGIIIEIAAERVGGMPYYHLG